MNKEEALQICRDVVKKDEVVTVIPIPVATLILDLYEKVEKLTGAVDILESKEMMNNK